MEVIINRLLQRFEQGSLSRRHLIQGLGDARDGGHRIRRAGPDPGFRELVSHISLSVSDPQRSTDSVKRVSALRPEPDSRTRSCGSASADARGRCGAPAEGGCRSFRDASRISKSRVGDEGPARSRRNA